MSANATEITQFANILRKNGDKVLNALSKLSLNAVFLQKINREFQLLIENGVDNEGSFQIVISNHGNSELLKDLNFLHDFIQKTVGLKITNSANLSLLQDKVDISKFKNIKYLEIKKIPIKEVIGLKNAQSQLESVVCIRCLSKLEELLASCGGDNSSGFVWSELREAVFSFNDIKVVDTSVAFAPWLQVLDLSHNQITDAKALVCLPNLKYVNLSFNCLDVIPTFNRSARKKIELLVIKNNYIENLSGLNGLSHLIELDLSNNWISDCEGLDALLSMSTLQWLSLTGNPISYHQNYRRSVTGYLHISASFTDFYLDKIKLSKKEKAVVGIKLCDGNTSINTSQIQRISRHSLKSKSPSEENNPDEPTSNTRKSGKARLIVIPNLDDGTYDEAVNDSSTMDIMTSSTEHLITKKRIENTRSAFGVDNWLVQGSSVVQDILGLPPAEITTSTPYDELSLKAALDSVRNVVTTTAVIETEPEPQLETPDKNNVESFVTCDDGGGGASSNYFSTEASQDKIESMDSKTEERENSKEVSPDIEQIQDVEEVEIDENEKLYVVLKEVKTFNNEINQEEMFLTITESELQERETTRGKIVTKWSLGSLESCIKLKPNQLHFVFDSLRRDKRERIYSLEEQETNILYKQIAEILESRTLSDMNQVLYKCEKCSAQFTKEVKSRKSDRNNWCPWCNSKIIIQVEEEPLPSGKEEKVNGLKNSQKPDVKAAHNRSSSTGGFFQSLLNQNENKILKCSSHSSIDYLTSQSTEPFKSSAASLDELNELPAFHNTNVKRSDSDIEILSNPSQSSIEVIDGPGRAHSGSTPRRKRSSEERQGIAPAAVVAATTLLQGNSTTGLTESSSSGSITDSICTAYESTSTAPSYMNKPDGANVLVEESEDISNKKMSTSTNFEPILQEVLKKARADIKKNTTIDLVNYSYSNFTNIDHRIKLFLYTHVFDDSTEDFSFGLRAVVVPSNSDNSFPSCIIASNKKLYFIKVTNCEQGDDARNFLQKVDSLSFNLNAVKCIYTLTWYQGFGIKIEPANNKWKHFLILLKDPRRTQNFLKFLMSGIQSLSNTNIIKETLERPYLAMQHLLLSSASLDDSSIQCFCLFNSTSITSCKGTTNILSGGLLTNFTELLLFKGNLRWLFDGSDQPPSPEYCQKFKHLVQVYTNKSRILFQFFNGAEDKEIWGLVLETEEVVETLLKSVRDSWEKLFSIPLQLSSF